MISSMGPYQQRATLNISCRPIGPASPSKSYLDVERHVVLRHGCTSFRQRECLKAVHAAQSEQMSESHKSQARSASGRRISYWMPIPLHVVSCESQHESQWLLSIPEQGWPERPAPSKSRCFGHNAPEHETLLVPRHSVALHVYHRQTPIHAPWPRHIYW